MPGKAVSEASERAMAIIGALPNGFRLSVKDWGELRNRLRKIIEEWERADYQAGVEHADH